MPTMRWSLKKIIAVCGLFTIIWFFISYSSLINLHVPARKKWNVQEIENRLDQLQKDVENEILHGSKLLNKMKQYVDIKKSQASEVGFEEKDKLYRENSTVLPILVISCDRVTVERCLAELIKCRNNMKDERQFPIIISQDCGHKPTYKVIQDYAKKYPGITVVQQPDLSDIVEDGKKVKFQGYRKIARHYKFALNYVLSVLGYEATIIIEDDLDISSDILEYFLGTYPLLLKDPSIWCVSAWNDNGKRHLIDLNRPELLHRTDFFPGLGWMLTRKTWLDLEPRWPNSFYDDWLRNPANINGSSCIRPEISRTYSFGKVGVSKGLFFETHLKHIVLNTKHVNFTQHNLNYLIKDNYDEWFTNLVYSSPVMTADEVMSGPVNNASSVRILYSSAVGFKRAAKKLGLMEDFRSGVPRTAYLGIVTCYIRGRRVYLAPDFVWTGYNENWN